MTRLSLLLLLCFPSNYSLAQTTVRGDINGNTTWTKANSPYIVDSQLTVHGNATLTIEPGVEVKVDSNVVITVWGKITAAGTVTDSIRFMANKPGTRWMGIEMKWSGDKNGGQGSFSYVTGSDAMYLFNLDQAYAKPYTFSKSRFFNNYAVVNKMGTNETYFDSCKVHNNVKGINCWGNGTAPISNCEFFENEYYGTDGGYIKNCIYHNNGPGYAVNYPLKMEDCEVYNNNIGVYAVCVGETTITGNDIHNNKKGVLLRNFNNVPYIVFKQNKICHNDTFNILYADVQSADLTGNCFCSKDSIVIAQSIFDGFDDPSLGKITFDTLNNCTQTTNILTAATVKENVSIYPQPVTGFFFVEFAYKNTEHYTFLISDITGRVIKQIGAIETGKLYVDSRDMHSGMYIYRLYQNGVVVSTGKLSRM